MEPDLSRFLQAQERDYGIALSEMQSGKKRNHWMWYIFPQLKGLGTSETSEFYGINDLDEARIFLNHPILGTRFKNITEVLLNLEQNNAHEIFGYPDDLKFKSCMTLFAQVDEDKNNVFNQIISKFFSGKFDEKTMNLLKKSNR